MRRNAPSAREPRGVPFALVDGRYAIARAQDESTLLRSLGKIWSDSRPGRRKTAATARSLIRPNGKFVTAGILEVKAPAAGKGEYVFSNLPARRDHLAQGCREVSRIDHNERFPGAMPGVGVKSTADAAARSVSVVVAPVLEFPAERLRIEGFGLTDRRDGSCREFNEINLVGLLAHQVTGIFAEILNA